MFIFVQIHCNMYQFRSDIAADTCETGCCAVPCHNRGGFLPAQYTAQLFGIKLRTAGRADQANTHFLHTILNTVNDLSGLLARYNDLCTPKFRKLLAQGWLANAGFGFDLANALFPFQQAGQYHQPLRLGQQA